jgi:hypothetical protein
MWEVIDSNLADACNSTVLQIFPCQASKRNISLLTVGTTHHLGEKGETDGWNSNYYVYE